MQERKSRARRLQQLVNKYICKNMYRFFKLYLLELAWQSQVKVDTYRKAAILSPEEMKDYHFQQGRVNAIVDIIRYLSE